MKIAIINKSTEQVVYTKEYKRKCDAIRFLNSVNCGKSQLVSNMFYAKIVD